MLGVAPCSGLESHPGRVEIFLTTLCYKNWDKLWSDGCKPSGPSVICG